jgi:formamidopyrimidine-DNA glycosylase
VPELPEVETVVRELRPRLVGRRITGVKAGRRSLRRPWSKGWSRVLAGQGVLSVDRRGKWILLTMEENRFLVIHLGMTGQLTVTPAGEPLPPHTHLVFRLDDGEFQLRFRDVRRFGSATVFKEPELVRRFFLDARLGAEPFHLDPDIWQENLRKTRRCVKAVLLDQRVVAGVGNIYADESLFEARLHPGRPGHSIRPEEAERLRQAMIAVLERAIAKRGSSIRDYVGGSGQKGEFQDEFQAYGRTDLPCPRCGAGIACIRLAGRSTHFCPRCQRKRSAVSIQRSAVDR